MILWINEYWDCRAKTQQSTQEAYDALWRKWKRVEKFAQRYLPSRAAASNIYDYWGTRYFLYARCIISGNWSAPPAFIRVSLSAPLMRVRVILGYFVDQNWGAAIWRKQKTIMLSELSLSGLFIFSKYRSYIDNHLHSRGSKTHESIFRII